MIVDTFVDHGDPHWPDVGNLMIPTGCWVGLPGNCFAFAYKQRGDPSGLCWGHKGEESFGVCVYMYIGV